MNKLKKILKVLILSLKFSPRNFIIVLLSTLIQTAKKLMVILFPAFIVNSLITKEEFNSSLVIIIVFCVLTITADMTYKAFMLLATSLGYKLSNKAALSVGQKGMKIDYENWEKGNSIEKIFDAVSGTWIFSGIIDILIEDFMSSIFMFFTIIYIFAEIDIFMIIPILFISIVNIIINNFKIKKEHKLSNLKNSISRKQKYNYLLNVDYKFGKEIRLYNSEKFFLEKFIESNERFKQILFKEQKSKVLFGTLTSLIYLIESVMAYMYSIFKYMKGNFNIGYFLTFSSSFIQFTESLKNIFTLFSDLNEIAEYYDDYEKFMKMEEKMRSGTKKIPRNLERFSIEFKNVSFKYENNDTYALKNVNFVFNESNKIAVVGENGSGKSTLAKLLLRLYDPTEGEILFNGINIKEISYDEYLSYFSTIFQDYKLHAYSLKENIGFDSLDEEKIWMLLDKFELKKIIMEEPEKLEVHVTKMLSRTGRDFSEGEKQKIALARAFYKTHKVLILDEPTSSFDPIAEMNFYNLLNSMISGSCLYITHRMASTKFADTIIVLDKGEIVESGSFNELIKKKGIFNNMYLIQCED